MDTAAVTSAPEMDAAPSGDAPTSAAGGTSAAADQSGQSLLEAELLVEEISIDGMCGVY
ncbi:MAG: mycofactocin precursor MftA [Ilumatobacteraceae bacterium]